jgi:hypothetical protein
MKIVGSIIAILTLFGILFGTYRYIDSRYALAEEVKKVEQRLDYKILDDQLNATQQRIWIIKERFKNRKMDETTAEEFDKLNKSEKKIQDKINVMEKK